MARAIDEHLLFQPKASKAENKADVTTRAALSIIGDEAAKRDAKTARLRKARMEAEATEAATAASAKPRAAKAAAPRRPKSS